MLRICTGDVWVRSSRASSIQKVSWTSREGCPGGMFTSSKL